MKPPYCRSALTSYPSTRRFLASVPFLVGFLLAAVPTTGSTQVLIGGDFGYSASAQSNIFFSTAEGDEAFDLDIDSGSPEFASHGVSSSVLSEAFLKGASHRANGSLSVTTIVNPITESIQITITVSGQAEAIRGEHEGQPNAFLGQRSNTGRAAHSYSGGVKACVPLLVEATGQLQLTGPGSIDVGAGGLGERLFREDRTGTDALLINISSIVPVDEFSQEAAAAFGVNALASASIKDASSFDVLEYDEVSSELSGVVTITITPQGRFCGDDSGAEQVYFWSGLDGAHADPSNWEPEGVPGQNDLAIFDKDAFRYSVSFSEARIGQAWVERGNSVRFPGGALALTGTDPNKPSLVVGNDAIDYAELRLREGHQLDTVNTVIGRRELPDPDVNYGFVWLGNGQWRNTGRLVVGQAGRGRLLVSDQFSSGELIAGDGMSGIGVVEVATARNFDPDAEPVAALGNVAIGREGVGLFEVYGPDWVASGDVVLGAESGSEGTLYLQRFVETGARWTAEEMIVGDQGKGLLIIEDGSIFQVTNTQFTSVVGLAGSGRGQVLIFGTGSSGEFPRLVVGGAGEGAVDVSNAILSVSDLKIGLSSTGQGIINLDNESLLSGTPAFANVEIGAGGLGPNILRLRGQSEAFMSNLEIGTKGIGALNGIAIDHSELAVGGVITIGAEAGDPDESPESSGITGFMLLIDAADVVSKSFRVKARGSLQGNGTVTVTGSEPAHVQGQVQPGVIFDTFGTESTNGRIMPRTAGFGTLLIKGDVLFDGAVLRLSVGGADDSSRDRLLIDGQVSVQAATLQLNFVNGYAPREGDELVLLTIGSLTGDFKEIILNGLAPGFDYRIELVEGDLVLVALNDATYDGPREDEVFSDRFEAEGR